MEVRCPQCHSPIELEEETELSAIVCSACGSRFSLLGEDTIIVEAAEGKTVGRFELGELLGSGAFASVWKARDTELDRTVAVKIPHKGQLGPHEAEQFLREARAAAQIQHSNIVSVHEVGREGDTVYIVSDLVQGLTLADWLTGKRVTSREAADLCAKIARALEHAHQAGVIHRDLKPANVMLDEDGEPHIMDFGLARRETGEVTMTMAGKVLGTPAYMSPEQARGEAHQADRRTDVYSLGVILFELLTGEKPFRGNVRMLLHQLMNEEAPSPRKLESGIPRDLETICLKCLEKDADKRFESAQELADELARFVRGEPIESRPISTTVRVWRWCRRKPVVAGLMATAALLLVAVAVVGLVGYVQTTRALGIAEEREAEARAAQYTAEGAKKTAERERDAADKAREAEAEQRRLAETTLADMHTSFGLAAAEDGNPQEAVLWFASAAARAQHDPERVLANRMRFGAWSRQFPMLVSVPPGGSWMSELAFHASSRYLMIRCGQTRCHVWDLVNDRPAQLPDDLKRISAGAWNAKGDRLAVGTREGRVALLTFPEGALLRSISQGSVIRRLKFSADGQRLAVVWGKAGKAIRVWDCETGKYATPELTHPEKLYSFSFNSTGTRLATTCADSFTRVFAVAGEDGSAAPLFKPVGNTARSKTLGAPLFIHGDRILVAYDGKDRIGWWDAKTGVPVKSLHMGGSISTMLKATPDGSALLIHHDPSQFGLRGIPSGEEIFKFESKDTSQAYDAAFSPDGQVLVTAHQMDHVARIWSVPARRHILSVPFPGKGLRVAVSPDARLFAVCSNGRDAKLVCVWGLPDLPDDRRVHPMGYSRRYPRVAMSADGRHIAPAGFWRHRTQWTTRVYDVARSKPAGPHMDVDGGLNHAAFSPDGTHLTTLSSSSENRHKTSRFSRTPLEPGRVRVWDWRQGKPVWPALETPSEPVRASYSPDGDLLVVMCAGGEILLIGPATGQVRRQLDQGEKQSSDYYHTIGDGVRFTSDGGRFIAGALDKVVRVWESSSGRLCHTFKHERPVRSVGLSKDEGLMATGTAGFYVATAVARVWDLATGGRVGVELAHPNTISFVEFSPDGQHLLTSCRDGMVRVWDWRTGKLACPALEHEDWAHCARFTNDGRWILTTGGRSMRMWEWRTGRQVAPAKQLSGSGRTVLVTPNGESAVVDGWSMPSIPILDLRDLVQPPHRRLSLSELRTLSEVISTRRVEGAGTTRMALDEWRERWQSLRAAWPQIASIDRCRTTLSEFAKALLLAQGAHRAFIEEAQALYRAREYEKAIAAYTRVLYLRPDDATALRERGLAYDYGLGQIEKGLADYTRAIELDPYFHRTLGHRARVFARMGQLEEALADANQSLRTSDMEYLHNSRTLRADVLALLGRWEEVAEDFPKYVEDARHSTSIWSRHALLRLHVAGVGEYRRVCRELMERFGETKEPSLANSLAWSCALGPKATPDMARCVALAEMAVAAKPEEAFIRNTLGAVLYRNGDFTAAVEQLNKSIELRGGGGVVEDWLFLAMSHHRLGHPDEARRWFEKATQWIGEHIGWDVPKSSSGAAFNWDSRLELMRIHKEAESLLSGSAPEGQEDAYGVVKDPEPLKAIIKKLDGALETSFRKASSPEK